MAKRKKQRKPGSPTKKVSGKLIRQITAAMALLENGEIAAARSQLLQLAKQYPRSKQVLLAILEFAAKVSEWRTYVYYGERLLTLERGMDRAETLNNIVYGCMQLPYHALTWYFAKELATSHPDYYYVEQANTYVETTEPYLMEEAEENLDTADLPIEEKMDILVQFDRVRFYTQSGYPEDSIAVANEVLQKVPGLVPILNNLSLSQFMIGDVDGAKATAERVVAKSPDNFHALSNLFRFHFLTGQLDQAQTYIDKLAEMTSDNPEFEPKVAEAYTYRGEDEKVLAMYDQAVQKYGETTPVLLYQAGVANYRLGNEKKAWRLWQEAVKTDPSFTLAQESLVEKSLTAGERDVPWYWPLNYWFPQDFSEILRKHLGPSSRKITESAVDRAMKALLDERPYLIQLLPYILELGDHNARFLAVNLIKIINTPDLIQKLYDFAKGKYGTDDLRMDAIQFISQNHPEMLPENKMVRLWLNGKQQELLLLGFVITDEPEFFEGLPEEIQEKHERAYELLKDKKPEAAEPLLREIIAAAPAFYSAYNQLALAYEMQGRRDKAFELIKETHARFPDYFFGRVGLARILTIDGQIEEADKLLEPLLKLQRLHISEFRALAKAKMDIAIAENKLDFARTWLEMWERVEEDHPELLDWQERINGPGNLYKRLQSLRERSRRFKK